MTWKKSVLTSLASIGMVCGRLGPFRHTAFAVALAILLLVPLVTGRYAQSQQPRSVFTSARPELVSVLPEALPESPGSVSTQTVSAAQATAQTATASISGVVLDVNDGIVPNAQVSLAGPANRVLESDSSGQFSFNELPSGNYQITINARGLETFVTSSIHLIPGEHYQLPRIALPIASAITAVQVTITEEQLATEQIKAAEKQRVLGVLPNFYTSYIWDAAPLNRKQKFHLAGRSIIDPIAFIGPGVIAGVQQARNTYPDFGQGAQGYAKRYGAAYGNEFLARVIGSAILPSIFHDDPRYFYKGTGSVWQRTEYAASRAVITRGDNGRSRPAYSYVLGAFAAGAISNIYLPRDNRGAGLVIGNGFLNIAAHAGTNIIREFISRQLTPSVPDFERGQAVETTKP